MCLDLFHEPKILIGCGHSFCEPCLKATKSSSSGKYTCPQCRKESTNAETNYIVKHALEVFLEEYLQGTKSNCIVGKSCCHTITVDPNDLTTCSHCDSKFCRTCLVSHKVFLRLESQVVASNVSCFTVCPHLQV